MYSLKLGQFIYFCTYCCNIQTKRLAQKEKIEYSSSDDDDDKDVGVSYKSTLSGVTLLSVDKHWKTVKSLKQFEKPVNIYIYIYIYCCSKCYFLNLYT